MDDLPSIANNSELIVEVQGEKDLIKEILISHNEFAKDYDRIYDHFVCNTLDETGETIFDFLKKNFKYTAEGEGDQTVKTPGRILTPGEKIDCKHYSLFAGGILGAIDRNVRPVNWCYRFASYNFEKVAAHVFVVFWDEQGNEIWLDPVLDYYDEKKRPYYKIDRKPGKMDAISGIGHVRSGRHQSSSMVKSLLFSLSVLALIGYISNKNN
jgi:hypothetical protein